MSSRHNIDMTGDHILRNICLFVYPLMISNLCQILFNAADTLIVGRFSGTAAMAAVGATSPIVALLTWGMTGFAIGGDVVVSRLFGAGETERVKAGVHTAYFIAIAAGLITASAGVLGSGTLLRFMETPEDIIADSILYTRIYFCGLFFTVVYNFGAACLRSGGDTKRPTMFMIAAGALNVVLNLVFVCIFRMSVAGVALATVMSQIFAASMVTLCLVREQGVLHLNLTAIRPDGELAKEMITIGLPSMLQNMCFSVSNIVIQSSVNSFGTAAVAGAAAAGTIEGFCYVTITAIDQACITFTGQNYGAGNEKNMLRVLRDCLLLQVVTGFTIGTVLAMNGHFIIGLFTSDETAIVAGAIRLKFVIWWVFLNGVMDLFAGSLRAVGYSLAPTAVTLIGICGVRLLYIFTVLPHFRTLAMLFFCYPLSWTVTSVILMIMWYVILGRKLVKGQDLKRRKNET